MNIDHNFFTPYMDVVFFFYGLAFFVLGIITIFCINSHSRFELTQIIRWLGGFGFIHSLLEWMDLWRILHGDSENQMLVRLVILNLSFIFLFEFGRRLFCSTIPKNRILHPQVIYPLLIIPILTAVLVSEQHHLAFEISSRHLLGFFGSILSAWGIIRYYHQKIKPVIYAPDVPYLQSLYKGNTFWYMKYACYGAMLGFSAYALFGGLVVPRASELLGNWLNYDFFLASLGFPVQVARTGCAIIIVISTGIILRLFQIEIILENYRIKLNSSSSGIYSTDSADRITFINTMGCDILGYRVEQLLGRRAHETFHYKHANGDPYPEEDCLLLRTRTQGNIVSNEHEVFWNSEGRPIAISYTGQPIQLKGRIVGVVVSFITCGWGTRPEQKFRRRTDPHI